MDILQDEALWSVVSNQTYSILPLDERLGLVPSKTNCSRIQEYDSPKPREIGSSHAPSMEVTSQLTLVSPSNASVSLSGEAHLGLELSQ